MLCSALSLSHIHPFYMLFVYLTPLQAQLVSITRLTKSQVNITPAIIKEFKTVSYYTGFYALSRVACVRNWRASAVTYRSLFILLML